MLKTMKYEVIRNKMVIIILFSILGGAEAIFLMGLAGDSRNLIGYGILGLVLGTSIIYFVIWLLGIMSFSHDLRDKTGYMVFLTPVNPYKIIIAKMLGCSDVFSYLRIRNDDEGRDHIQPHGAAQGYQ